MNHIKQSPLLDSISIGGKLKLKNKIVMAPMTRCKAIRNLVPNPKMAEYYAKRARAGLIITEATIICSNAQGYPNTPGIFTSEQIEGWQYITDSVHSNNGKIFLQLWHVGRVSHPMYLNGDAPVAPSPISINGLVPYTKLPYTTPRELLTEEISEYIKLFKEATINAKLAGFDGVEIHAANGYLIDQFMHHDTNKRTDKYGGTTENMSRFLIEIIDTIKELDSSIALGVRISPVAYVNGIIPSTKDKEVFILLLEKLEQYKLDYLHTAIDNDFEHYRYIDNTTVSQFVRENYNGTLIACGNYDVQRAEKAIQEGKCDLVAFAKNFLANPDLIKRIECNQGLNKYEDALLKTIN